MMRRKYNVCPDPMAIWVLCLCYHVPVNQMKTPTESPLLFGFYQFLSTSTSFTKQVNVLIVSLYLRSDVDAYILATQ